ncbi:M24 family metallopeptidase [Thalassovita mangrovi]|uniref:M24 family metallopeptidase n=1 Tax=Thalassovita mangrovi TaxID=2692236 RepID=A0A6L8LMY8_9RHOB|nr:Xaa-Pro peptidase family protein [Thalassovita mangrovi]MYM56416.1 M24 family metallopeptidase [Thalassovita mangrovi]
MAERSLAFPAGEYARRIAALQSEMALHGCDALLLTAQADIFYATGFLTRFWESPARPWFVVVPAHGDPIAVIPSIGQDLMARSWISDIRTWDAPDPIDDGVGLLSEVLCETVPGTGCIGVPMGLETSLRMPLGDYARVTGRIAPRRFIDATEVVHRVREVKSEAEIDRIRTICAIADAAFDKVPDIVREGPALDRVFRQFQMALLAEGADWVSYTAGGAGQGGYGDVISPAAPVALREGDILMLDTGAVKDGYFCDFDRNFAIGTPSDDARHGHAVLHHATEAALAQLRPGMRACDAHRILSTAIAGQGAIPGGGRLGHGLGVTLTEWPSFTTKDLSVLREGMVLTLEPAVVLAPGRIMVHEENIVLRADGPELLSRRAPAELPVIAL